MLLSTINSELNVTKSTQIAIGQISLERLMSESNKLTKEEVLAQYGVRLQDDMGLPPSNDQTDCLLVWSAYEEA